MSSSSLKLNLLSSPPKPQYTTTPLKNFCLGAIDIILWASDPQVTLKASARHLRTNTEDWIHPQLVAWGSCRRRCLCLVLLLSLRMLVILNVLLFAFIFFIWLFGLWLWFSRLRSRFLFLFQLPFALLVEFRLHGSFWDFCRKLAFVAPLRRCWLRRRLLNATSASSFGARSRRVCLCTLGISN